MTPQSEYLEAGEFNAANPLPADLLKGCDGRTSTALEYFHASRKKDCPAGKHIDAGHEPYLAARDAVAYGLHPFVEVEDVACALQENGNVRLFTARHMVLCAPDTLIFWR